jgi:hypothetical protein
MSDPERPLSDPSEVFGYNEGWTALHPYIDKKNPRYKLEYEERNVYELYRMAIEDATQAGEPPRTDIDKGKAFKGLEERAKEEWGIT